MELRTSAQVRYFVYRYNFIQKNGKPVKDVKDVSSGLAVIQKSISVDLKMAKFNDYDYYNVRPMHVSSYASYV